MIRFAVIGTNWITERFIDAAHESGKMKLTAIYSRHLDSAKAFGEEYPVSHYFDSLDTLASSDLIDAVYIASPNSLHCQQALLFLSHKKHVICEKPLASTEAEVNSMIACAKAHDVVLFEAFKTAYLPNFLHAKSTLERMGKLRKAVFNFGQYSSRYPRYLAGENPNTFNPEFSNGSIMDIGYYCLASSVALFGEPQSVIATATLLESGVDGQGTVLLNYENSDRGSFEVVINHSKIADSYLPSEIQGEEATLLIDKISTCPTLSFYPRGNTGSAQDSKKLDISQLQHINTMLYEAETFSLLVENQFIDHPGLQVSRITAKLLDEIRRQTGVIFPADSHQELK